MAKTWSDLFEYYKFLIMRGAESLEEFYERKFQWVPEEIRKDIGHFNLFKLKPDFCGPESIPYRRRDFYKVMLMKGHSRVHYADKVVEVKSYALSFSNPKIPYKWEHIAPMEECTYCIFSADFFHQFGHFHDYEVYQPNGTHIFELTEDQAAEVRVVFDKMEAEFKSEYKYKYDAVRNQIFELLHYALKLQPSEELNVQPMNASRRIAMLFMELLERQFPIDEPNQYVAMRSASEFAEHLNVHVNHLNRSVKEATEKTTTQLIAERILQEAKVLLKQTAWSVSEIAYALGFNEVTHFNNFFKKHQEQSPLKFRNA
ncbi:helix-turn-helix domain-containing protein [Roseivirga pacifica]|uniref:helix-turn-helix domain-containing protein n=1 Tax=Roseivirga pacifica TaxID=1267423 RepID=UPI00293F4D4E|nr:helix-turn-helix transcriptional regulator [Roseivirga pacifica]